jgi:hypothetical protein
MRRPTQGKALENPARLRIGSAVEAAEAINLFLLADPKVLPPANSKAEKSKLRFHKEAFRTLLCGHLILDLAGIALDYFWVLMFVRIIHLALSFCVILASVQGLVDVVLLTFLQKSKIIFACDY